MSRATADVERMLTLVPWLLERPGASLSEVAEAFSVGERVIRKDLEHLDFCGLPGLGGGDLFEVDLIGDRVVVSMADELKRPLRPTPSEALRLVLTVDAVADLLGDELPALRTATEKIRAALSIPQRVADVLADEPTGHLQTAREAVRASRRVELGYQGRGDTSPRTRSVDPWALHVEDGVWYLQGFDHTVEDARTFRLDRVSSMELTDVDVEVQVPEELPAPRYRPSEEDLEVVIEVDAAARWIVDAVDPDELTSDDGVTRVHLRTDAPSWIVRLVLMAAGNARIIEPAWLRDEVAVAAIAALTRLRR